MHHKHVWDEDLNEQARWRTLRLPVKQRVNSAGFWKEREK